MSKNSTTDLQLIHAARGVDNFRGVFMIDELPIKPRVNESAIVNLNTNEELGSYRVYTLNEETRCDISTPLERSAP